MPASGIAAISVDVRSHFFFGLIPTHRKTILAAAHNADSSPIP
jgi:hypothetical protein